MASLGTNLFSLSDHRAYKRVKNGLANIQMSRLSLFSILAYVSGAFLPIRPSFGLFQIMELQSYYLARQTCCNGKCSDSGKR
jgi:VIT1/CCC1 family predicted Fe2+/Mn2+ transporter